MSTYAETSGLSGFLQKISKIGCKKLLALYAMILLNPNTQKYFVYTQLSLKSQVCPLVNNAIQFNIISNQQKIQCTGGQSLSSRNSCSLLQGRFIANSLTKSPMPILNHNPISPKRTVPDTPYQQNKLFISHKKRLLPLKKLPMCSGLVVKF